MDCKISRHTVGLFAGYVFLSMQQLEIVLFLFYILQTNFDSKQGCWVEFNSSFIVFLISLDFMIPPKKETLFWMTKMFVFKFFNIYLGRMTGHRLTLFIFSHFLNLFGKFHHTIPERSLEIGLDPEAGKRYPLDFKDLSDRCASRKI